MAYHQKDVKTGDVGASPYPPSGEITIQGEIHPKKGKNNPESYVVHPRCPVFTTPEQREIMTHSSRHRKSAKSRRLGSVPSIWSNFYGEDYEDEDVRFVGVSYDGQLNGRDAKMFPDSSGRLAVMIHGAVTMVVDERYLTNPTFGDYLYFEPIDSNFRIKGNEKYGIPIIKNCKPDELLHFDGAPPAPGRDSPPPRRRTLPATSTPDRRDTPPSAPAPSAPASESSSSTPASDSSSSAPGRPIPPPRRRRKARNTARPASSKEENEIDLDTANILNVLAGLRTYNEDDKNLYDNHLGILCKLAYHAFLGKKQWMFARINLTNKEFWDYWSRNRDEVSQLSRWMSNHKNDLFDKGVMNPFLCLPIDGSRDSVFLEYCILGNPKAPGFPYYIHKLLMADVKRKADVENFLISISKEICFRIHTDNFKEADTVMNAFKDGIPEEVQSSVASWDPVNLEYFSNFGMHGHTSLQKGVHQIAFDLQLNKLETMNDKNFRDKIIESQKTIRKIYEYLKSFDTPVANVSMGVGANELHNVLEIFCRVCRDGPLNGKTPEEEAKLWNKRKNSPLAPTEVKYTANEFFSEIASYSPEIVMMILKEVLHDNKYFFFDHPLMLGVHEDFNFYDPQQIDFDSATSDEQISGYYSAFFGDCPVPEFNEFLKFTQDEEEISTDLFSVESYFKPHGIDVASIMSNLNQTGVCVDSAGKSVNPNRIIGIYLEHTPNENQVRVMLRNHGSLFAR